MKKTLQAVILPLLIFAADLHGSAADHVRQSFTYNPSFAAVDQASPETKLFFVREEINRELQARFAPKPPKVSAFDALNRFTFVTNLKEDSILEGIFEKIDQINEAYKDLKNGFDTNVMGASLTVYVRSKIVWKVGRAKTIEINWTGTRSIGFAYAF